MKKFICNPYVRILILFCAFLTAVSCFLRLAGYVIFQNMSQMDIVTKHWDLFLVYVVSLLILIFVSEVKDYDKSSQKDK